MRAQGSGGWRLGVTACAAALLGVLASSPWSARAEPSGKVTFDHAKHLEDGELVCSGCHASGAESSRERPAKTNHRSCDAEGCHVKDFYGKKNAETTVCRVCHTQSAVWADMRQLWPYPDPKVKERTFYVEFNHKAHMARRLPGGGEPECGTCHRIDAEARAYTPPSHAECKTCHGASGAKVGMDACGTCHVPVVGADGQRKATKPSLKWDVTRVTEKFSHQTHRQDRRSEEPKPVSCETCHGLADQAERVGEIKLVSGRDTMEGLCRGCHDARQKTAEGRVIFGTRGSECKRCHSDEFMKLYYTGRLPASH